MYPGRVNMLFYLLIPCVYCVTGKVLYTAASCHTIRAQNNDTPTSCSLCLRSATEHNFRAARGRVMTYLTIPWDMVLITMKCACAIPVSTGFSVNMIVSRGYLYTFLNNIIHTTWCHEHTLIARFMGPTRGPYGVDRAQVGPMLAPWILLSGHSNGLYHRIFNESLFQRQDKQIHIVEDIKHRRNQCY